MSFWDRNEDWIESVKLFNILSRRVEYYQIFTLENQVVKFYLINGKCYGTKFMGYVAARTHRYLWSMDEYWKFAHCREASPEMEEYWDIIDGLDALGYVSYRVEKPPFRSATVYDKRVHVEWFPIDEHELEFEIDLYR